MRLGVPTQAGIPPDCNKIPEADDLIKIRSLFELAILKVQGPNSMAWAL